MPKIIQIRGVPDDVYAELTSRAGRNAEIFAQLREMPATSITDEQIIEDIRAERDRVG